MGRRGSGNRRYGWIPVSGQARGRSPEPWTDRLPMRWISRSGRYFGPWLMICCHLPYNIFNYSYKTV